LAPLKLKRAQPPATANVARGPGLHFFKRLINDTPPEPPGARPALDDLAVLQYTGGTTGIAKGAMLTHRNLSYNMQQLRVWFPDLEIGKEVMLGALPMFHSFGMTVAMNFPIGAAAAMVLIPDPRDVRALVKRPAQAGPHRDSAPQHRIQSGGRGGRAHGDATGPAGRADHQGTAGNAGLLEHAGRDRPSAARRLAVHRGPRRHRRGGLPPDRGTQ